MLQATWHASAILPTCTPDNKDYPKLGVMLVPFEDFKAWTLSKMPIK